MFKGFANIFKVPDLRNKILFTFLILFVYRLGAHIPTPGINADVLLSFMERQASQGTLLAFYDLFAGGAFSKATVFALGIMPYISASIIIQLLTVVVPQFEKLQKEGESGRKKLTQYTRFGTVLIAIVQSAGMSIWLKSGALASGMNMVILPSPLFQILTVITFTTGTMFIMWLGEQISEYGIGNGISIIIFVGIVARVVPSMIELLTLVTKGQIPIVRVIIMFAIAIGVTALVVVLTLAARKIPIQYPKQIRGRRMTQATKSYLPLRVNTAGVIPIIFGQAVIMLPATLTMAIRNEAFSNAITKYFSSGSPLYILAYAALIIFFTYFYTAIQFNPVDIAENMKKYGGFIPGKRPGKKTADYIDSILSKLTLIGAVYLAAIAVLPMILIRALQIPPGIGYMMGGTSIMILVGVALDTLQQVESQLVMRHYEGFMKRGKIKSRYV
ncbi:preprotein translocase subunit SecY [Candidatus Dependentiae bacterium]|nr:preprotein translocase subunit SecY [Candidatus Dependentiae bacterium]